jgi:hypothetical protein
MGTGSARSVLGKGWAGVRRVKKRGKGFWKGKEAGGAKGRLFVLVWGSFPLEAVPRTRPTSFVVPHRLAQPHPQLPRPSHRIFALSQLRVGAIGSLCLILISW